MLIGSVATYAFVTMAETRDVEIAYNEVQRAALLVRARDADRPMVVANLLQAGHPFWGQDSRNPSIWIDGRDG